MKINFKGKMSKNLKMNFKVVHKKVKTLKDDFECYQLIMFLAFFSCFFQVNHLLVELSSLSNIFQSTW